jgi:hypothetical protein
VAARGHHGLQACEQVDLLFRSSAFRDVLNRADPGYGVAVSVEFNPRSFSDPFQRTANYKAVLNVIGRSMQRSGPRPIDCSAVVRVDRAEEGFVR